MVELVMSNKNSQVKLLKSNLKALKQKNDDLEITIGNIKKEEEEKYAQLMIKFRALECEKRKAEIEVEDWKIKCKELELRVLRLHKELRLEKMKKGIDIISEIDQVNDESGAPLGTSSKHSADSKLENVTGEGGQQKNISPSTSGVTPSVDLVDDISDSADHKNLSKTKKRKFTNRVTNDNDDPVDISESDDDLKFPKVKERKVPNRVTSDSEGDVPPVNPVDPSDGGDNLNISSKTSKKTVINGVTSESESDDSVPLSKLRSKNLPAHNVVTKSTSSLIDSSDESLNRSTRKRRLIKPGKSPELSMFTNEIDDDNEMEEDDFETESLGGFIVDRSDGSEHGSASDSEEISENDGNSSGESQNESENSMGYDEIMSGLRREKKHKLEWEYEADMLAEFDKNSELCMEAVCALYRQQIEKEKSYDDSGPVIMKRGFNKYDAGRGMELGYFITDGHPDDNVKKTVEELKEYNPYGTDLCLTLANKYSTQLFKIYKNGEDPYFCPTDLVRILNSNV